MTNGDKIRSLSDEELYKAFSIIEFCEFAHSERDPVDCPRHEWVDGFLFCEQCALKWLRQEVEE